MTTTDPKLIERIARAIHEARSAIPWEVTAQQDIAYRDARAAAAIVAAAINEAVQNERAGIVAIMRDAVRSFCDGDGYFLAGQISVRLDAIERGEHLPSPPAIEAHKESGHG